MINHRLASLFLVFVSCLFIAAPGLAEEPSKADVFKEQAAKLAQYSELITHINAEKQGKVGTELRALGKQLLTTESAYRKLLWQSAADLVAEENQREYADYAANIKGRLVEQSGVINTAIKQNDEANFGLEQQIADAKKSIFTTNQAVAESRISDLSWRLHLQRLVQEELYSSLVRNAQSLALLGVDSGAELNTAKTLVAKQADMLSGLIGLHEDRLIKLEKQLSAVRNESTKGKKLISDIALKNLEIQDYAGRLEYMVDLLGRMDVDASLYKKTVLQAKNSLNADIFDGKVASHLFTEWWLDTKKWFAKEAPAIISQTLTFIGVMLLAWIFAGIARRMMRGLFNRTRPGVSELAKNFIVSMVGKVILVMGFLIALSNLGIQIGPILAGLGIMGFIIGFALQETLSNFASGLMILIYRPFDVGDKIRVSGLEGKVNDMTLVSTTIFTSANHHLTIPNNKIWKDIIHNITSQPQIRMDLFFTAPFSADSETVLDAIREEIEENTIVVDDKDKNARIYELGDIEVKYIARFWISSDDIDEARWVISEGVKRRFDKKGISSNIVENFRVRAG